MTVRFQQPFNNGVYFITFTCYNWLPLFQTTSSYHLVYKWFDYLKQKGNHIIGYVIMPNHLHAVIAFRNTGQSINTRVGNGKRFLAYGIIEQLTQQNNTGILNQLKAGVNNTDKKRGKLHQVFQPSFDCKECISDSMLTTKLQYIHNNPCTGKWNLAEHPSAYEHSSAGFYYDGKHTAYEVMHVGELNNIDLSNV